MQSIAGPRSWFSPNRSRIVPIEQPSNSAQQRAFLTTPAPGLRRRSRNPAGQTAQWQRLQPNSAGAAQIGKEQTFTAKQRGLDFANVLDVVIHRWLKSDDATGIHTQQFAGIEVALINRAPGMNKRQPVALQTL